MEQWIGILTKLFEQGKAFTQREVREYFDRIAQAFAAIPVNKVKKTKVGIVGRAALANPRCSGCCSGFGTPKAGTSG